MCAVGSDEDDLPQTLDFIDDVVGHRVGEAPCVMEPCGDSHGGYTGAFSRCEARLLRAQLAPMTLEVYAKDVLSRDALR